MSSSEALDFKRLYVLASVSVCFNKMAARRIILNILATYGRSIVSLFLGLMTTRWILAALGKSDYGLCGVVGSIIFFVTFLNEIFSQAISRFYAYSIGKSQSAENDDVGIRVWFNTSLSIHIFLPVFAFLVGFPIGEYAIRHWLVVPPDRINACCWFFRFSTVTAILSMLSVPYRAMYLAYQIITELAFFTLLRAIFLFLGAFCLSYIPGDKLIVYAILLMAINSGITLIQMFRAHHLFTGCRIIFREMFNRKCLEQIFLFFSARFMQGLGWGLRGNGSALLTNVYFGSEANASFSVAGTLSAQATSFSTGLANAFAPAITTAAGAGDREAMLALSLRSCKFGTLLVLVFGVPLIVEMNNWLHIWLENPPDRCWALCVCMVITFVLDYLTVGHHLALSANGKIFKWQLCEAILLALTLPVGWLLVIGGVDLFAIGLAYIITFGLTLCVRLWFGKRLLDLSVSAWFCRVLLPVSLLIIIDLPVSIVVSTCMEQGILRLGVVAMFSLILLLLSSWFILFDGEEKAYVIKMLRRLKELH